MNCYFPSLFGTSASVLVLGPPNAGVFTCCDGKTNLGLLTDSCHMNGDSKKDVDPPMAIDKLPFGMGWWRIYAKG